MKRDVFLSLSLVNIYTMMIQYTLDFGKERGIQWTSKCVYIYINESFDFFHLR